MIVPLVAQKFVKVALVVEELLKSELPDTVRLPPKYTLPVELTERREPGVVVPIPTFPPNVAKPEALNVVVVALVADRLLIQAVSETVR